MITSGTKLTSGKRTELARARAFGVAHVLSVGVNSYLHKSGFHPLKKCSDDAIQFATVFKDIKQLGGDPAHIKTITSLSTSFPPSRGNVMNAIHELSEEAADTDRIFFFFSGHGHRLGGEDSPFLVPQDAYASDDRAALISLEDVLSIVRQSKAKQSIVMLDACMSGPTLLGKKLRAASFSAKFLTDYLDKTKGVVVMTACAENEASHEKSPNPKLSLFTHYLTQGLSGATEALDGQFLTLPSLFDYVSTSVQRDCRSFRLHQTPAISKESTTGTIILGDFSRAISTPESVDLSDHPLKNLRFRDSYKEYTKAVLTEWRNRSKPIEQLEYAANNGDAMANYVKSVFKEKRSALRTTFGFSVSDIGCEGAAVSFPGGSLEYHFDLQSKDSGVMCRTLELDLDWFEDPAKLQSLFNVLSFRPTEMELPLNFEMKPLEQIAGLEANGWAVESEDDDEVVCVKSGITVRITMDALLFSGFDIKSLLGTDEDDRETKKLFSGAIALLAPRDNSGS